WYFWVAARISARVGSPGWATDEASIRAISAGVSGLARATVAVATARTDASRAAVARYIQFSWLVVSLEKAAGVSLPMRRLRRLGSISSAFNFAARWCVVK